MQAAGDIEAHADVAFDLIPRTCIFWVLLAMLGGPGSGCHLVLPLQSPDFDGDASVDLPAPPDLADASSDVPPDLADASSDLPATPDLAKDTWKPDWNLTPHSMQLQQGTLPTPAYVAVTDTRLEMLYPTTSFGSEYLATDTGNDAKHTLIRFQLAPLPAGAWITEATLVLHKDSGTAWDHTIGAYLLKRSWSDSATWNGPTGGGSSWDVPGALGGQDCDSSPSATALLPNISNVELKLNLTSLVQYWLGGGPNNGVLLRSSQYSSNGYATYHSSEASGSTVTWRPKLMVTYLLP